MWANTSKKTVGPCQSSAVLQSPHRIFQTSVSALSKLLPWPNTLSYQKRAILYTMVMLVCRLLGHITVGHTRPGRSIVIGSRRGGGTCGLRQSHSQGQADRQETLVEVWLVVQDVLREKERLCMVQKDQRRDETGYYKISATQEVDPETTRANYVQRVEHRLVVQLYVQNLNKEDGCCLHLGDLRMTRKSKTG